MSTIDRREAIKRAALLSGFALSSSMMAGLMQSCQAEPRPDGQAWKPVFFNEAQGEALAEIGETILPATDTPGAKDVGVHEFIDQFVKDCLPEEMQLQAKAGLDELLSSCQSANGKPFLDCSPEERLAFLNSLDAETRQLLELNPGLTPEQTPFFMQLKQLVLIGYFTSEKVGTEVLAYSPVPGRYEPCLPYEAGQPAWTIDGF